MSRAYCSACCTASGAVIQAELDAGRENVGNFPARRQIKFFMDDIAAERQRQPVVLLAPPDAEVFAHHQSFVLISQLAFVNDQADFGRAIFDGGKNLVERHDDVIEFLRRFAEPELQRQKRAGHGSGHGDFFFQRFLRGKISVSPRASGRSRRPCSRRWAARRICRRRRRRRGC